jgi:hypothetical protein
MTKPLEYISEMQDKEGGWNAINCFQWKFLEEEMAIIYASVCIRKKYLSEAEANFKGYRHPEPLRIAGKTKMVEIHNAVGTMDKPMILGMEHPTGSKDGNREFSILLEQKPSIFTSKETGLQAIASIGWIMDIAKARPPEITTDNSSVDYEEDLLPENLEVKEESAPSGYNKAQIELLQATKDITSEVLSKCGELSHSYNKMGIVQFGHKVFKTYAKVFGSLPDPEEEERERFNQMREEAKAKKEEEED